MLVEQIKSIQGSIDQLQTLEEQKSLAVEKENYDEAGRLTDKIKQIKMNFERTKNQSDFDSKNQFKTNIKNDDQVQNQDQEHLPGGSQKQNRKQDKEMPKTPKKETQQNKEEDQTLVYKENLLQNKSILKHYEEIPIELLKQKQQELNQKELIEEYENGNMNQNQNEAIPIIDKKSREEMQEFTDCFSIEFLEFCFSSVWKHKQHKCEELCDCVYDFVRNKINLQQSFLTTQNPQQFFIFSWKLACHFLNCSVPQIAPTVLKLYQGLLKLRQQNKDLQQLPHIYNFPQSVEQTLLGLIGKVSEIKNQKLADQIAQFIYELTEQKVIKQEDVFFKLLVNEKVIKIYKGVNQIVGRFQLSSKLINLNRDLNHESIEIILKACLMNLENPKKDIREAVLSLVIQTANIQGKALTLKFFKNNNLRPNIYTTLENELNDISNEITNDQTNQEALNQQEQNQQQIDNSTCQFCEKFNPLFGDPQQLNMHYYKECPLLINCPYCQQVLEIQDYEQHIASECSQQGLIQLCPFCEFPYFNKEEEQNHKKHCKKIKPQVGKYRCPLCFANFKKLSEDDRTNWVYHILLKKCPSNK